MPGEPKYVLWPRAVKAMTIQEAEREYGFVHNEDSSSAAILTQIIGTAKFLSKGVEIRAPLSRPGCGTSYVGDHAYADTVSKP